MFFFSYFPLYFLASADHLSLPFIQEIKSVLPDRFFGGVGGGDYSFNFHYRVMISPSKLQIKVILILYVLPHCKDFHTHSQQQCFQVPSALIFYALFNVTAGNLFVGIKHWNRNTEAIRMALQGHSECIKRLWTHIYKHAPFLRCSALLLPSMLMNLSSSVPNFSSPAANSSWNTINEQTLLRFAT